MAEKVVVAQDFGERKHPARMPDAGRAFVLAWHERHGLLLLRSPPKPKKQKPAHCQLPGGRARARDRAAFRRSGAILPNFRRFVIGFIGADFCEYIFAI